MRVPRPDFLLVALVGLVGIACGQRSRTPPCGLGTAAAPGVRTCFSGLAAAGALVGLNCPDGPAAAPKPLNRRLRGPDCDAVPLCGFRVGGPLNPGGS